MFPKFRSKVYCAIIELLKRYLNVGDIMARRNKTQGLDVLVEMITIIISLIVGLIVGVFKLISSFFEML